MKSKNKQLDKLFFSQSQEVGHLDIANQKQWRDILYQKN